MTPQEAKSLLNDLLNSSDSLVELDISGSWREPLVDTIKRRQWEIDEMKHEIKLKKLRNEGSTSFLLLKTIMLLVFILIGWGLITGEIFAIGTGLLTLFGGGAGTLFYRHKAKGALLNNAPTQTTDSSESQES